MLSYTGLLCATANRSTLELFGGWRGLAITLGTFVAGVTAHAAGIQVFPSLQSATGSVVGHVIDYSIYGVLGSLLTLALTWLYFFLTAPHQLHQEQLARIEELCPADGLDLYFHSFVMCAGQHNVQLASTTVTNRSAKRMHLQIWAQIEFVDDEGKPQQLVLQTEWNPDGLKPRTGYPRIDLDSEETFVGSLFAFLPDPSEHGLSKWAIEPWDDVVLVAHDSVTGSRVAFRASPGHPDGKMSLPLPPIGKLRRERFQPKDSNLLPGDPANAEAKSVVLATSVRVHEPVDERPGS